MFFARTLYIDGADGASSGSGDANGAGTSGDRGDNLHYSTKKHRRSDGMVYEDFFKVGVGMAPYDCDARAIAVTNTVFIASPGNNNNHNNYNR